MAKRSSERKQFLTDVLVTGIEGGIDYWAAISAYKPDDDAPFATIRDFEDESDNPAYFRVDLDAIARGIEIVTSKLNPLNEQYKSWIRDGSANNDACDVDSECADVIIQAGVLGSVVYG